MENNSPVATTDIKNTQHNTIRCCLQDILRLFELNEFYLQINKTVLPLQMAWLWWVGVLVVFVVVVVWPKDKAVVPLSKVISEIVPS